MWLEEAETPSLSFVMTYKGKMSELCRQALLPSCFALPPHHLSQDHERVVDLRALLQSLPCRPGLRGAFRTGQIHLRRARVLIPTSAETCNRIVKLRLTRLRCETVMAFPLISSSSSPPVKATVAVSVAEDSTITLRWERNFSLHCCLRPSVVSDLNIVWLLLE